MGDLDVFAHVPQLKSVQEQQFKDSSNVMGAVRNESNCGTLPTLA